MNLVVKQLSVLIRGIITVAITDTFRTVQVKDEDHAVLQGLVQKSLIQAQGSHIDFFSHQEMQEFILCHTVKV